MGDFTIEGYNDKPKPCQKSGCNGTVKPTWNADVGKCDTCQARISWAEVNNENI